MAGRVETLGIGWLYQAAHGKSVNHCVYLVEKLGFHLAALHLEVTKTQLEGLFAFHVSKIQIFGNYLTNYLMSFAEVS